MKVFSPGQIASSKDVNDNFAELSGKIGKDIAASEKRHAIISPGSGRIGTPPSGAVLRLVAWTATARTNQWGQAELDLPTGVKGIATAVACSARFDTEDSQAYLDHVAITAAHNNRPIVTITRNGTRRANTATFISVMGIGW